MSDISTLLGAIAGLVTALGGAIAAVIAALRLSSRERPDAARRAAEQIIAAAEDGDLTPEEIAEALKLRRGQDRDG